MLNDLGRFWSTRESRQVSFENLLVNEPSYAKLLQKQTIIVKEKTNHTLFDNKKYLNNVDSNLGLLFTNNECIRVNGLLWRLSW